jgi:hypothetical protein
MTTAQLRVSAVSLLAAVVAFCAVAFAGNPHDIPSVDGGAGGCRANFTVHDTSKKPIYNATISVTLHYGFLDLHKTELQVGTNGDGKARFTGLPNFPKKPLEFEIQSGSASTTVTDHPSDNCYADFDVTLEVR